MKITKLEYTHRDLQALPAAHVSAFLSVGHFLNEANLLRKLILVSNLDETGNEAEEKARLILSLTLANSLAVKIHAGWMNIRKIARNHEFSSVFTQPEIKECYDRLTPLLAKNSLLHRFRNTHGAHYPATLSLAQLPNIADADVALYRTVYDGDTLSLISALCAAGSLVDVSGDKTVQEALQSVIAAVVHAADIYCSLLLQILSALVRHVIKAPSRQSIIANDDACSLSDVRLRFFCDPPVLNGTAA